MPELGSPGPEHTISDSQLRGLEQDAARPPETPGLTEGEQRMALLEAARAESTDTTADLAATRRERLERLANQGVTVVSGDLETAERQLAARQAAKANHSGESIAA